MDKVIRCHCGFEARAEHEEELVAEVQRHALETHGMALSHDEALLLAFRAELDALVPPGTPANDVVPDPPHNVMSSAKEEE